MVCRHGTQNAGMELRHGVTKNDAGKTYAGMKLRHELTRMVLVSC